MKRWGQEIVRISPYLRGREAMTVLREKLLRGLTIENPELFGPSWFRLETMRFFVRPFRRTRTRTRTRARLDVGSPSCHPRSIHAAQLGREPCWRRPTPPPPAVWKHCL
jgi:hypothetical protein